ncbi:hypothetical protein [Candidatus Nitrosotenuis uzonensis]|uniref:Uncharacterized protein n=1 Tax=Candidatus Nitrosotenuis uzonensis TaxID=1407055 RepID=V6ARJ0_9ARCH|nr:hypothetical protein [Candidatus Nitrosotenuis uzonensis]CDI05356.1 conserved hypothetical protein [Candidatus Nitrosotenuis uzonensis]
MGQFFTDDVDELIRLGHGDQERLNRIKSEYQTKKLVTLEDRRYVEGLIARYMRPAAEPQQEKPKAKEERIVPPPPTPPKQQDRFEIKQQKAKMEKPIPKIGAKKMRNIAISVASVAVAVVIIGLVSLNQGGISLDGIDEPKNLELDQKSYYRGDIISISGRVSVPTSVVSLGIFNTQNQPVWTETVNVDENGEYSTLVIAGGDGWEQAGTYAVTANYVGTQDQANFSFNPTSQD